VGILNSLLVARLGTLLSLPLVKRNGVDCRTGILVLLVTLAAWPSLPFSKPACWSARSTMPWAPHMPTSPRKLMVGARRCMI